METTIDYDSLTCGKLCPLKAIEPPDLDAILRVGAIKCRTDGEPPHAEYIGGPVSYTHLCGAPMTDEAVEMVMERWEVFYD